MTDLKLNEDFLYIDQNKLIKSIAMPKLWHIDPTLILIQRIFGTRELVVKYLKEINEDINEDEIINGHNFIQSVVFDELLNDYQVWMTETLNENINSTGNTFETITIDTMELPIIKTQAEPEPIYLSSLESDVPIKTVQKTVKKPKKAIDLDVKVKDLEPGKIINISTMNDYGIGTRIVFYKNPKNMFITRDERIMTNNYNSFELFINLLKKKKYLKRYEKDLILAKKYFNVKKSDKKLESSEESLEIKPKKLKKESSESSEEIKPKKLKKKKSEEIKPKKSKKKKESSEESEEILNENDVDIFDFDTYKQEYKLLSKYFQGLELFLRTALLIDYKYNHLNPKNRQLFEEILNEKSKKEQKKYIELMLDVFEPLYILHQFYRHYSPSTSAEKLDQIYEKYSVNPSEMFNRMYRRYVDDNWKDKKMWF